MKTLSVSILMPALNEEKNILPAMKDVLRAFDELDINGELIVIDDGSRDATQETIVKFISEQKKPIQLISHDKPLGIGSCFWDGLSNAKGEIVCMLPGDNENDARQILRYLKLMDDVDIVSPFAYNKGVRTPFRNVFTHICRGILNISFVTSFSYTNGTILYRKSILSGMDYKCHSPFFQADILVRLTRRGYLFAEVPYRIGARKTGRSKIISLRPALKVIKDYFRLLIDVYIRGIENKNKRSLAENSASNKRYKEQA